MSLSLIVGLISSFAIVSGAQSAQEQTLPVIEIVHVSSGGYGYDKTTVRLYADGRDTSETSGTDRSVNGRRDEG